MSCDVPGHAAAGFGGAFWHRQETRWDRPPLRAFSRIYGPDGRLAAVVVPHWAALAVACLPAVGWLVAARRRQRRDSVPAFEVVRAEV